jgi:predicted nucleic acid-binding protein
MTRMTVPGARQVRHKLLGDDLRRCQEEYGGFARRELAEARTKILGGSVVGGPRDGRLSAQLATVVLDAEGFAALIAQDRELFAMLQVVHDMGAEVVVAANTVVEVSHAGVDLLQWERALSRVRVEPVTEQAARAAAELLRTAGLHGRRYAVGATVAEVALRQALPVAVVTSDSDDMARLCGGQVRLVDI